MPTWPDLSDAMTVAELAKLSRHSVPSVHRWIAVGVAVPGRVGRVKLSAVRVGGRWFVTREGWEVFFAATNPAPALKAESPSAQRRRIETVSASVMRRLGMEE